MRERQRSDHARDDDDTDDYLDLDGLARYSKLSVSTLRRYLKDPVDPLPDLHMHQPGKRGRRIFSKRDFDAWVRRRFSAGTPTPRAPSGPKDPRDPSWILRAFSK